MNVSLFKELEDKFKRTVSQYIYEREKDWVYRHLNRISNEFYFLEKGKPVKLNIDSNFVIVLLKDFIISPNSIEPFIGIETTHGNVWYYEALKPTKKELEKFDGHYLQL